MAARAQENGCEGRSLDEGGRADLRRWFGHEPERFAEFKRRYQKELSKEAFAELRKLGKAKTVTLLYGAKDPEMNQAAVLLALLHRKR